MREIPAVLDATRGQLVAGDAPPQTRLSISGAQTKVSIRLEGGRLVPVETGGEFILKPIPSLPARTPFLADVPENERLTMSIAGGVFGIVAPRCALVRLADGEPAYLVERFDRAGGRKLRQEDFCQLLDRATGPDGESFKYDGSYEELGRLLRERSADPAADLAELFRRVAFCYAFSNGDAHLRNFSLLEAASGGFRLSPAYDLLCTSMHFPGETPLALDFFADDTETDFFARNGFLGRPDFLELARRYGIADGFAAAVLDAFPARRAAVAAAVADSVLSPDAKADYLRRYDDRLRALA